MRGEYRDVNGVQTRLIRAGKGAPLLLIHPVGYSADIWLRNIDHLGAQHDVVAVDLIGHGFTGCIDLGTAAPQAVLLHHLKSLIETLGWDRFSVIGSSLGSQLAALLALHWPGRIDRLVLVGSGSTFSTEAELAEALPRVMRNGLSAIADATVESCRRRVRNTCHDLRDPPEEIFLCQMSSYARPGMVEIYRAMLEGMMDLEKVRPWRVYERLEQIGAPTLIVSGHEDTRAPLARAIEASQRIPDARLLGISDCGHLPFLEHPDLFNEKVGAFLCGDAPSPEPVRT